MVNGFLRDTPKRQQAIHQTHQIAEIKRGIGRPGVLVKLPSHKAFAAPKPGFVS